MTPGALLSLLVATVVAAAATPGASALARSAGLLDHPGGRKTQATPMPLLGGVAIALGVAAGALLPGAQALLGGMGPGLLGCLLLALLVGMLDDSLRNGLPPLAKVAGLIAAGGVGVLALRAGGAGARSSSEVVLAVIWFVGVSSAFNISDNMDGLTAGLALAPVPALLLAGLSSAPAELAALAGAAALGFLPFNFPRARLYMGDAGSHLLGASCALASCPWIVGWSGIFLVAVPLLDAAFVSSLRLLRGHFPWVGDRNHLSHQLVARGAPPWAAVVLLWLVALLIAVVGWTLSGSGSH
ncbi:MAG: MraY family glycosyltransferase [Planctomycetota bacterium]